jgi:hypothetical protein
MCDLLQCGTGISFFLAYIFIFWSFFVFGSSACFLLFLFASARSTTDGFRMCSFSNGRPLGFTLAEFVGVHHVVEADHSLFILDV